MKAPKPYMGLGAFWLKRKERNMKIQDIVLSRAKKVEIHTVRSKDIIEIYVTMMKTQPSDKGGAESLFYMP